MDREELIRMAESCSSPDWPEWCSDEDALERFVALVAKREREACAKFVEDEYVRQFDEPWRQHLARSIRARGQA